MNTTREVLFIGGPTDGMFTVRAGLPAGQAMSQAACLAESIAAMALTNDERLDAGAAYLIWFVATAIQALCNSAEVGAAND